MTSQLRVVYRAEQAEEAFPILRGSQGVWLQTFPASHAVSFFSQLNHFYRLILGEASRGSCNPPMPSGPRTSFLVPLLACQGA